jgi:hypothetical protein
MANEQDTRQGLWSLPYYSPAVHQTYPRRHEIVIENIERL